MLREIKENSVFGFEGASLKQAEKLIGVWKWMMRKGLQEEESLQRRKKSSSIAQW